MSWTYLDYAAATPVDDQVLSSMQPYYQEHFFNPAANYQPAIEVRKAIDEAQNQIASILGAKSTEIIFTSGGTESNNLAISGIMNAWPGKKVIVSSIEHESVLEPAKQFDNKLIKVDKKGIVDLDDLVEKIDDSVVLVSIMQANNEIGTIQPIRKISQLIKQVRSDRGKRGVDLPIYFHTDSCQAAGYLDIHVHSLGVDLMSINSGKIYGPKQSGVLYVNSSAVISPQIIGGGQQRGNRSGTQSAAAAVGLAKALEIAQVNKDQESRRLQSLQKKMMEQVVDNFPNTIINGSTKHRLPNNLNFSFLGHVSEVMLIKLEKAGIIAAAGSACGASDGEVSHVMKALGVSKDQAESAIRFSMGRQTRDEDIDKTLTAINSILA